MGLTGNALARFVQVTTLLSLIDPVRGEASVYSLDRHPHDETATKERLQKKFLDSFALICSTAQGEGTECAATMEVGHPSGTIIRIARNTGVPPDLLLKVQAIVHDLMAVASKGKELHCVSLQI